MSRASALLRCVSSLTLQKQGRFEVYEGDAPPLSPPIPNGAALMEKALKPATPTPLDRCAAAAHARRRRSLTHWQRLPLS